MSELQPLEFNSKITELCNNKKMLINISERLEGIKKIEDKEDFENYN